MCFFHLQHFIFCFITGGRRIGIQHALLYVQGRFEKHVLSWATGFCNIFGQMITTSLEVCDITHEGVFPRGPFFPIAADGICGGLQRLAIDPFEF